MPGHARAEHLGESVAAPVPKPRVNLTRFHGVFAPQSRLRAQVTSARGGKRDSDQAHKTDPRGASRRHELLRSI